jgi:hypothetical protein
MAHILGIGTLWTLNNNVNGTTYNLYTAGSGQYTGPNALTEYKTEFNQPSATFVPVELGGGGGTANGMDFTNELMTGWASSVFFVSRTTLDGIDDLGYTVDYSKAGVVNHTVVPECSSLILCLAGVPWIVRRRR